MIGDKTSAIAAARTAGLPVAIHVLTGQDPGHIEASLALNSPSFRVHSATDLADALRLIKNRAGDAENPANFLFQTSGPVS